MVIPLVEIASILCNISQSNPRGAAHELSGNSFRGGVSRRFTRRPKGQSTVEYVLVIAIIVLVILIAGPWVSSAIGNQFNLVAGAIGSGTTGENFYEPVDIPDPENGTAFAVYSEDDQSLMFYKRRGVPQVGDMFNYRRVTEVYTGIETTAYAGEWNDYRTDCPWAPHAQNIKSVRVIDKITPISMSFWFTKFYNCTSFEGLDLIDTENCISFERTFSHCHVTELHGLGEWNMSNAVDISCIFDGDIYLSSISGIENWDVSKVENSWQAFYGCQNLNRLDLSKWRIAPKGTAQAMFYGCFLLQELNLSGFDFSQITNAWNLFKGDRSLVKVTVGSGWKWIDGDSWGNGYLPVPDAAYISGADGKWYSASNGTTYIPSDIPSNKADTYYASKTLLG